MNHDLDEHLWLQGDEDGDVSVQCWTCDRRGEPVVFYTKVGKNPYDESQVPTARTIADLAALSLRHIAEMHAPCPCGVSRPSLAYEAHRDFPASPSGAAPQTPAPDGGETT